MPRPYEPPRHLAHLSNTRQAFRTQVGWGVHEDGSVGIEHIMSSNPFAGKSKVWGIAEIDDQGDVQIISKGPGNSHLSEALPEALVSDLTKFYEHEGLNVRNIREHNPDFDKQAEIDQRRAACPQCGSGEVFVLSNEPHHYSEKAECEKCGWAGDQADLIEYGEDPDPDRKQRGEEELDHFEEEDDWSGYVSKKMSVGVNNLNEAVAALQEIATPMQDTPEEFRALMAQVPQVVPQVAGNTGAAWMLADAAWINSGKSWQTSWNSATEGTKTAAGAPFSTQGAPAGGNAAANGTVVRPDRQSRAEIEQLMGGLESAPADENYREYIDTIAPDGAPGGYYNNPYVNRGGKAASTWALWVATAANLITYYNTGVYRDWKEEKKVVTYLKDKFGLDDSTAEQVVNEAEQQKSGSYTNSHGTLLSDSIEDHFLEAQDKTAAPITPPPAGIPATGPADMRNFSPDNQPGFIVVSQYLTPDDNWIFTNKCRGIIAETGGTTSHGAVIARAMGIPAIVSAEGAAQIQPGDSVTMDPNTGRIDVNGGDQSYEIGEVMRAANEVVRFVWSQGTAEFSPVTTELTEELAKKDYEFPGQNDRAHAMMMEYMIMEDRFDYEDGSIGVIYDDGRAIYYEPITDAPELENWLRSNFPNLVEEVVYKATAGGIYQPEQVGVAAKTAELEEAPKCPECESHSYKVIELPVETRGVGTLGCLNCGAEYTHDVIQNPKSSKITIVETGYGRGYGYDRDGTGMRNEPSMGVPKKPGIVALCGNCGEDVDLDEVNQNDGACPACQMPLPLLDDLSPRRAMISESIDDHFFEAQTVQSAEGKWSAGTRVELQHNNLRGKGTILECSGRHDDLEEDLYVIQLDNGEKVEDIPESAFKKIKSAGMDEHQVNDTSGAPIQQGELYLMHSTQYKVPDLVRIINITPQRLEAHIDSDASGMFPIEIDPAQYVNLGYSFEPYTAAHEDNLEYKRDNPDELFDDVQQALMGQQSSEEALEVAQQLLDRYGPTDRVLQMIPDADALSNFLEYNETYMEGYESKIAARRISVTPKRQKELINENMNGRARNFDKLNLEDTHYIPTYDLIPKPGSDILDDYFLW